MGCQISPGNRTGRKKCLVVCGPTASGKSGLADLISSESDAKTILVDSMQVYREIPEISNQRRDRPAALSGFVSVTDEWSVARHRDAVLAEMDSSDRVVLDAGTGMYLNAILLDFPLAPKVSAKVRSAAISAANETPSINPRRLSRELELKAIGSDDRGSVWDGNLRFDTHIIYLRPDRNALDQRILTRSRRIVENGTEEAKRLLDIDLNPTVSDAIGVREMLLRASGEMTTEEAVERISTRTRRLARRQMRWFDKLLNSLGDRARAITMDNTHHREFLTPEQTFCKNCIHDIIEAWKD